MKAVCENPLAMMLEYVGLEALLDPPVAGGGGGGGGEEMVSSLACSHN